MHVVGHLLLGNYNQKGRAYSYCDTSLNVVNHIGLNKFFYSGLRSSIRGKYQLCCSGGTVGTTLVTGKNTPWTNLTFGGILQLHTHISGSAELTLCECQGTKERVCIISFWPVLFLTGRHRNLFMNLLCNNIFCLKMRRHLIGMVWLTEQIKRWAGWALFTMKYNCAALF